MQRLKLFDKLNADKVAYADHQQSSSCCSSELSDEELLILDDALICMPMECETEAALYYVSGYVAFKENVLANTSINNNSDLPTSEFLFNLSRGGLCHPEPALVGFARCCYFIFQQIINNFENHYKTHCSNRFHRLFICLGEVYPCDFLGKLINICRRLINIFYKGCVKAINDNPKIRPSSSSAASQRKQRKLNYM